MKEQLLLLNYIGVTLLGSENLLCLEIKLLKNGDDTVGSLKLANNFLLVLNKLSVLLQLMGLRSP